MRAPADFLGPLKLARQEEAQDIPVKKILSGTLKIGYITECLTSDGLDPEIKKSLEDTIAKLKSVTIGLHLLIRT